MEMPVPEAEPCEWQLEEIRPGRYVKMCNGKVLGIADDGEVKKYFDKVRRENLEIIQKICVTARNLTEQLLLVDAILAGFIFTIMYDVVLVPQATNDFSFAVNFVFLSISGFFLLVSLVLGVTLQFVAKAGLEDKDIFLEIFGGLDLTKDDQVEHVFTVFALGAFAVFVTLLFGMVSFMVSVMVMGWMHSFILGMLSTLLTSSLIAVVVYAIYKILPSLRYTE